jgi:5-enolpyruvylshikimate-3-phosphate synthase
MAMAFAPLSFLCDNLQIKHPSCVNKSYRDFWDDLKLAGFILN